MNRRDRWLSRGDSEVVCIACGATVPRSGAREYDKAGDRWDREDKQLEYLCKPCHRECCHQPRDGLEAVLVEAGAGTHDDDTFLERYYDAVGRETHNRNERSG